MKTYALDVSSFSRANVFSQCHVPSCCKFFGHRNVTPKPHLVRDDVGMLISQALGHFASGQEIAGLVGQHRSAHIQHANVLMEGCWRWGFYQRSQHLHHLAQYGFVMIYRPCFIIYPYLSKPSVEFSSSEYWMSVTVAFLKGGESWTLNATPRRNAYALQR